MSSTSAKVVGGCVGFAVFVWLLLHSSAKRFYIQVINDDDQDQDPVFRDDDQDQDPVFRFASYYQNHMVLQAAPRRAIIWGYGSLGAQIEVQLNIYTTYKTVVKDIIDGLGVWSVTLDTQPPGTRAVISASSLSQGAPRTYSISDVVFGDVWLCSGQSNMGFPLGHVFKSSEELENVHKYSDIRIFMASQEQADVPLYDLKSIGQNWSKPTSENAQFFSAVCWLYGRNLYDELNIPIGLISTYRDETEVELWSSPRALASCGLKQTIQYLYRKGIEHPVGLNSSVLWNAMVHPFLNMTIRGAIWYQGESNAYLGIDLYNCTFPAMIKDWRQSWYEGTNKQTEEPFPFGFVQIATVTLKSEDGKFPLVRWHQTADFGHVPNSMMPATFMAVAMDLPDPTSPYDGSIHPRDKQDVGLRLSSAALSHVYNVQPAKDGPIPVFASWNGGSLRILYSEPNLKILQKASFNFEICCSDNRCEISDLTPEGFSEWHSASIISNSQHTIHISSDSCPNGVKKVRYAWSTVPCKFKNCEVYNTHDFPAPPFVMEVVHHIDKP